MTEIDTNNQRATQGTEYFQLGEPSLNSDQKSTNIGNQNRGFEVIRRAFKEFLMIPSLVILFFFLLAIGTDYLDRSSSFNTGWFGMIRSTLQSHIFSSPQATSSLLSSIATGLITLTSITFSLLLLALQQAATSLTVQVYDQFLHRWENQFVFGYFVGLTLYSLIILATVADPFNPVYGSTLTFLLAVMALYLLIILIYMSINQMRPTSIVQAIRNNILRARERQRELISKTYRESRCKAAVELPAWTERNGFVTWIDAKRIDNAMRNTGGIEEVELLVEVGSEVVFGQPLAVIKAGEHGKAESVVKEVLHSIIIEQARDISRDPAYGIYELSLIAWTSSSTAKSNPGPALQVIHGLRDILSHWALDPIKVQDHPFDIVYPDHLNGKIFTLFESLSVVSSESMQHQTLASILFSLAELYGILSDKEKEQVNNLIIRVVSSLGDQVLTRELDVAILAMIRSLNAASQTHVAHVLQDARDTLAKSLGTLNSRSTRVPSDG